MTFVQPPNTRYTVEDTFAALRITIPAQRSWRIILFLGLWLVGWAAGEFFAGTMLLRLLSGLLTGNTQTTRELGGLIGGLGLAFWLTLWTVGGGFALAMWMWTARGKEIIGIDTEALTMKKSVFGVGRSRRYSAVYIDRLRASRDEGKYTAGPWNGSVMFDYGGAVVRFGAGLSEKDALELAAQIAARFPSLAKGIE